MIRDLVRFTVGCKIKVRVRVSTKISFRAL